MAPLPKHKKLLLCAAFFLAAACLTPQKGLSGGAADTARAAQETDSGFQSIDSLFSLYQPYMENISAYRPMYFLVGLEPEKSKFQISLKYRFLTPESAIGKKHPWSKRFYLAYTQTSFWDLDSASQPFKDTSYQPELFYLSPALLRSGPGTSRLFLQSGFQHESNGRGADASRSTNYAYIRPIFIFYHDKTQVGLQVAPRIWAFVGNDDDTNPDLDRYRGYFALEVKAGQAEGLVVAGSLRWAAEGGSMSFDATYPLHRLLPTDIDVYLQAQYVNALAESLLDYQDRSRAVRLGISIVR